MKTLQVTSLIFISACQFSVQAATNYWDINGATPGAGGAVPSGTWNTAGLSNWTTSATGSSAPNIWADDDDAVFSAGTDATGAFTVTLDNATIPPLQKAGNLTVQEGTVTIESGPGGYLNVGGGLAGKGIIEVAGGATAIIKAEFDSSYGPLGNSAGVLTKKGTGTLLLGTNSFYEATTVIAEGVLAISAPSALGSTLAPTIVSNGTSLEVAVPIACSEPAILNGFGVSNRGALYGYAGAAGQGASWGGGAVLNSTARINHYSTNGTWWNWAAQVITTNGVNSADLYVGGAGNSIRLNINIDYPNNPGYRRPPIDIGDGVLYKDGTVELRLENACLAREVRFNGGHLLGRCGPGTNLFYRTVTPGLFWVTEGVFWSGEYVPATIYVGPNAGEFRNGSNGPSQEWDHPIELEAGANPVFRARSYVDAYFVCNGIISGAGGISKFDDTGTLILRNTNTYSGATTIRGGMLTLGPNGSISNSVAINLWTNGIFNVTSNTGDFVLQPAQTLAGNGTVLGNLKAKGTIAPGDSIGSLTNSGNLTLGGGVAIEVNKSLSPGASNDFITVTGTLSHGGGATVTVVNLGPALSVNDSFKIFSQAVTGGQTIAVSGGGATWTNKLAVDGSIAVTAVSSAAPATNVTIQVVGPTSLSLGGMGAPNSAYKVFASTNVAAPMSNWWLIGVTNSTAGGVIQFLDSQATNAQRFYRFGQ